MKKLGLFLFLLSFSTLAKESLHLRAFVPVTYKVKTDATQPQKVRFITNEERARHRTRLIVKQEGEQYKVSIIHP